MAIDNLTIIGERINPGFASVRALFDSGDMAGIQAVALEQVNKGARALDVNLGEKGEHDPAFAADVVRALQEATPVPLVFDSPSAAVQRSCLAAYDPAKAEGALPIVNSVSELRWEIADLLRDYRFRIILMASEREERGKKMANRTVEEICDTAARMRDRLLGGGHGLALDDLYVDVSIGPIGADTGGATRTAVEAIGRIGADAGWAGVHFCVGLSNIGAGLPRKTASGLALRPLIESAFLTLAVPLGLDSVVAAAGRKLELLAEDHPVLVGFREALALEGYRTVMRIRDIYRNG